MQAKAHWTLGAVVSALAAVTLILAPAAMAEKRSEDGPRAEPSIIGGDRTTVSEWPWQVALLERVRPNRNRFRQLCGGTLLAPTVVLTAAHCVFYPGSTELRPARDFRAATGRTKLASDEGQELGVKKIHAFRKPGGRFRWNPFNSNWDVVLLELKAPSTSTPIKIAGPDERALWAGGQDAWVTGWGATNKSGSRYPDTLREAKVQINSQVRCRSVFAIYERRLMVCAGGGEPERDTCYGDSGGPLVAPMAGGGFRLIGDTSFGGRRCGAGAVFGLVAGKRIREAVQAKVLDLAGVDPVGSGATAVAPTMPPYPLTIGLAKLKADAYLFRACGRNCLDAKVSRCRSRGEAFKCKVKKFVLRRWKEYTLSRKLRITEAATGAIKAEPLGKWKRRRGWPKRSG